MMAIKPICILEELPITDLSLAQTLNALGKHSRNSKLVALMADVSQLMRCVRSAAVQDACLSADLILAEGEAVRVAAAMIGTPLVSEAFGATDLIPALMQNGSDRFFILGGSLGEARRAAVFAARCAGRVPCPAVGGVPGGFCRKGRENTAVLTRIWECQPDVVVIGMEDGIEWLAENLKKLPSALYICVPAYVIGELAQGNKTREREWISFDNWRTYYTRFWFYRHIRRSIKKEAQ